MGNFCKGGKIANVAQILTLMKKIIMVDFDPRGGIAPYDKRAPHMIKFSKPKITKNLKKK